MQNNTRYIFRFLAGGYVLYLAFQLFQGLPELTGAERIYIPIAIVVFVLAGLGIIVLTIRDMKRSAEQLQEEETEDVMEEEDSAEENRTEEISVSQEEE